MCLVSIKHFLLGISESGLNELYFGYPGKFAKWRVVFACQPVTQLFLLGTRCVTPNTLTHRRTAYKTMEVHGRTRQLLSEIYSMPYAS